MANIKGIEVSSETYNLEDTNARTTASSASTTANTANTKATANETAIATVQAVIPSSASASNKLVTESELPNVVQETAQNISLNESTSAVKAQLGNIVTFGKVLIASIVIENLTNDGLGSDSSVTIGTCQIRPKIGTSAILLDYKDNVPVRLYITPDGSITIAESVGVVSGANTIVGELVTILA